MPAREEESVAGDNEDVNRDAFFPFGQTAAVTAAEELDSLHALVATSESSLMECANDSTSTPVDTEVWEHCVCLTTSWRNGSKFF